MIKEDFSIFVANGRPFTVIGNHLVHLGNDCKSIQHRYTINQIGCRKIITFPNKEAEKEFFEMISYPVVKNYTVAELTTRPAASAEPKYIKFFVDPYHKKEEEVET